MCYDFGETKALKYKKTLKIAEMVTSLVIRIECKKKTVRTLSKEHYDENTIKTKK